MTIDPKWASDVQAVHAEAAGCVKIYVLTPDDLPKLFSAKVLNTLEEAQPLWGAAMSAMRAVRKAPRGKPMLCAACPRPLSVHVPFTIAVAVPARPGPSRALTFGICPKCFEASPNIEDTAGEALRAIWPGLHPLVIHPQEGHA